MDEQRLALAEVSDEELVRRARSGSAQSFEELVRRYQVPLLRFLARRFPNHRDAEDLLQETFLRAYEHLGQYRQSWRFRTWLFGISHHLAVSAYRAARLPQDGCPMVDLAAPGGTPQQQLQWEEERKSLWDMARSVLSEEQFNARWLYYVEQMPAGQIAQVLGRSWVSVKTMLHRARRKLRVLAVEGEEERANAPVMARVKAVKAGES